MKEYTIKVTELHEVEKTYYIDAPTKVEAVRMAKNSDWHDASADEPTGTIRKVIIEDVKIGEVNKW